MPGFLRGRVTVEECRRALGDRLARREESFLLVLARGVYGNPRSPYRALLAGASVELGDVARLVDDGGVEGALERLYDAGVHVTQDELKRARPIERLGIDRSFAWEDFDNPLLVGGYTGTTGGSRSAGRRVQFDLDALASLVPYHAGFLSSFGLEHRPHAVWRAAPPATAAFSTVLQHAKLGRPVDRWFSQTAVRGRQRLGRDFLVTAYTAAVGRALGVRIPLPEHVRPAEARIVAEWVAEMRARGTPPLVSTTASSGVRVCLAARDHGLDVRDTFFRLSGEPLTRGRAEVLTAAGARAVSNYSMSEAGRVGIACADAAAAADDLHLAVDGLGVIQREQVPDGRRPVGALVVTTLLPSAPKLLLNAETDDYGTLEERACGCFWGELGFTRHVSAVRSHEKLTSEGMNFAGADLHAVLEETLPGRFGGDATDYQLVEEEVGGLPRLTLVVSPRVGEVSEGAVAAALLAALERGPAYKRMMAAAWRDAEIVRVVRRDPYVTSGGKIQLLHAPPPR